MNRCFPAWRTHNMTNTPKTDNCLMNTNTNGLKVAHLRAPPTNINMDYSCRCHAKETD